MSIKKFLFWLNGLILFASISVTFYLKYESEANLAEIAKWSLENEIKIDKSLIHLTDFKIEYNENEWQLLLSKLKDTKYFEPLNDKNVSPHQFGFNPKYSRELVNYWSTKFDWKKQINKLNKYPQFKLHFKSDDITVHFMRFTNKKESKTLTPLLMIDGWPGSFSSFQSLIDYVDNKYGDMPLDIIVPSIPGYGYSTPLNKIFDTVDAALYFDAMMRYIHGEDVKYFVHGEDWGAAIASNMAKLFPQRTKGIHVTMTIVKLSSPVPLFYGLVAKINQNFVMTKEELANNRTFNLDEIFVYIIKQSGYFHLQATKPVSLFIFYLKYFKKKQFNFNHLN
jgi:microsomal epoxide hydrolase